MGGGAGESGPSRIPGGVSMTLSHRYNGNPSSNPADPIPVRVTVGLDAQLSDSNQVISGIQFFTNGDFNEPLATTVLRFQTVPGEGIQTYIPPVIHELDPIVARTRNSGLLLSQSAGGADSESEAFGVQTGEIEDLQTGQIRVFFRVVDDVANKEATEEIDLPVDSLENVLDEFKKIKLRNGHYRIYIEDPATGKIRLMHDVHLFNGRLVPPNFREGVGERLPGANDGAEARPLDGTMGEVNVSSQAPAAADPSAKPSPQQDLQQLDPQDSANQAEAGEQDPPEAGADVEADEARTRVGWSTPSTADVPRTESWKRQSQLASLAAGAAAIAAAANWKDRLIRAEEEGSYDLSRAARRRRRWKRDN